MYIDLLLLFLVSIFVLVGYSQGFIRQLFSILSLVAIVFFAHPLASWLKMSSGWQWFAKAPIFALWGMSAIAIFFFTMILEYLVFLNRKDPQNVGSDRWLGMAFGSVKGLLLAFVLGLGFHVIPQEVRDRFPQFEKDGENSIFISASQNVMGWKALSSVQGLQEIRDGLAEEHPLKKLEKTNPGPWSLDDDFEQEDEN